MTESSDAPVGTAAEEAARLLGAVADWASDHGSDLGGAVGGLADQVSAAAHDVDAHLATGEDCRYCPICRALQVYRAASPEVREHLAAAATSLAQAVTAALHTTVPDRRPGVEHIDLTDDWPDDGPADGPAEGPDEP